MLKITITEAIASAKTRQSGIVINAMLEQEDGKLVYEIEFLNDDEEIQVTVDDVIGVIINDEE